MSLQTLWFILIAVLWTGYLFLEGFDLGVGMHMRVLAKNEQERRVLLNTIGPVWDGNEVWLLTAGGATFAAFPMWYAALFSALYIPLTLVLVGLIIRAVSIEYRGKIDRQSWRDGWTNAMAIGSLISAFGIGAGLALTTTGLPINANGDRDGNMILSWLTWQGVLGGLALIGFALIHGAAFIALKTDGDIRQRARHFFTTAIWWLVPIVAWVLVVQFDNGKGWTWAPIVLAVIAVIIAFLQMQQGNEKLGFLALGLFLICGVVAIFGAVYPTVLPSTLDSAWDLTIRNSSSSTYTLKVMSIVAAIFVPIVLLYQAWSYYTFRKRISTDSIPGHTDPTGHAAPV